MSHPVNTRLVIGPNASMTVGQAWLAGGWVAVVAFTVAGFFAIKGFWPVLPFAGMEIGAFVAALWVCLRRNRYREVLTFDGNDVRIEFGLAGRGAEAVVELRRDWLRVLIEPGPHRNSPTRLVLSSFGQRVEVARCLTDEERERLAARIGSLTGSAWRVHDSAAWTATAAVDR
jgi:uncharacterized membrane protein